MTGEQLKTEKRKPIPSPPPTIKHDKHMQSQRLPRRITQ